MSYDASSSARELELQLAAIGSPERAEGEKRYLKSDLEHLGTTVGQLRGAVRAVVRAHRGLTHTQLTALVRTLWERPVFECRLAAVLLLQAYPELVRPADLPLIQKLVRGSHTIHKAIGWVLRETSKRDPELVHRWLAPRIDCASGVTVREAVKYLEPAQRDELMGAYKRRGRPGGRPRTELDVVRPARERR